jgi:penicillin-binding protein 2
VIDHFQNRQFILQAVFSLVAGLLIFKAFDLQILNDKYAVEAEATAMSKSTLYPSRGLMYDRKGKLLINNNPVYDVMVTYNQIDPAMDTIKFCDILGITKESFKERLNKNFRTDRRFSKFKPFVFLNKVSSETYALFQESLYEFPGFDVQIRNVRVYPHRNAAHVLGYIQEVNNEDLEKGKKIYVAGDYIGASGLERQYESDLRGKKGGQFVLKDNRGRDVGKFMDGKKDTLAISGSDLVASIDIELQGYAEELMKNKIGAIVAIEPNTGEILVLSSTPSYDPNLLTINRGRGEAYSKLAQDSLKPIFNRATMAKYPPGSIFKPVVALIALQEKVTTPSRYIYCPGFYTYNNDVRKCRNHPIATTVGRAIQYSCNSYFFQTFREIVELEGFYKPEPGLETFTKYLYQFGLGYSLGIDFPQEKEGNVPTVNYYNKLYPKNKGGWKSPTIMSLGIGQGEMQLTTVQMANLAAILANKGYFFTPHLAKGFKDGSQIDAKYLERNSVEIDASHFPPVINGMIDVVESGTARGSKIPGIIMAGKTGTVQNSQGEDHSTFIAFAPVENPKIAIAVYVENAGGGGRFAAPIASLLIEQYLNKEIASSRVWRETQMLEANLISKLP